MRLWSIHPKYLDPKGLVALWRETLLAQKVLQGRTKGYKHHPQLIRFRDSKNPLRAIGAYLSFLQVEATARGYSFDATKIEKPNKSLKLISVTSGQVEYEITHLKRKLEKRDPEMLKTLKKQKKIAIHPIFKKVKGEIESWEII